MIWFAGDPHGRFDHIINAVRNNPPQAIVLLGDMECTLPLDRLLKPILDLTSVYFIPGNHDADTSLFWDNLVHSGLYERNLHGTVQEIDGVRVAGLGGIFEEPVWMPGYNREGFQCYQEMVDSLRARGEPKDIFESKCKRYRATIFPDDYFSLCMENADILVTHQAPSYHRYGFSAIDELAEFLGANQLFHGHYHEDIRYEPSPSMPRFEGFSVGFRSIVDQHGKIIHQHTEPGHRAFRA